LEKQRESPSQTGEAIAVRSTRAFGINIALGINIAAENVIEKTFTAWLCTFDVMHMLVSGFTSHAVRRVWQQ
jgi:hypothetical protein